MTGDSPIPSVGDVLTFAPLDQSSDARSFEARITRVEDGHVWYEAVDGAMKGRRLIENINPE